jgi:hypothetical protein
MGMRAGRGRGWQARSQVVPYQSIMTRAMGELRSGYRAEVILLP